MADLGDDAACHGADRWLAGCACRAANVSPQVTEAVIPIGVLDHRRAELRRAHLVGVDGASASINATEVYRLSIADRPPDDDDRNCGDRHSPGSRKGDCLRPTRSHRRNPERASLASQGVKISDTRTRSAERGAQPSSRDFANMPPTTWVGDAVRSSQSKAGANPAVDGTTDPRLLCGFGQRD